MKLELLTKLAYLAVSIPVCCFSAESSPARFGSSTAEFIENVRLPDVADGENRFIKCASMVSPQGEFGRIVCYSNDGSEIRQRTIRSIQRAAGSISITPATVEEEAVVVWFSFTLAYGQSGDVKSVQVLENHLYNAEQLGVNYVSAQRYDFLPWRCDSGRDLPVFITLTVSRFGEISEIESSVDPTTSKCAETIVRSIEDSKFIPAQVDEMNVTSTYIEAFYTVR